MIMQVSESRDSDNNENAMHTTANWNQHKSAILGRWYDPGLAKLRGYSVDFYLFVTRDELSKNTMGKVVWCYDTGILSHFYSHHTPGRVLSLICVRTLWLWYHLQHRVILDRVLTRLNYICYSKKKTFRLFNFRSIKKTMLLTGAYFTKWINFNPSIDK